MLSFFRSFVVTALVVAGAGTGCFPDLGVDAGVNLTCASDDDCPDGFNCKALDADSFCIAAEVLAKEPLRLLDDGPLTIAAPTTFSTAAGHNKITATFALSEAPKALRVSLDGEAFACDAGDGGAFTCTLVVTDSIAPGSGQVRLQAHDEALNPVDVSADVFIDDAGPAVLAVSRVITPPSAIRQAPSRATLGSRVDVVIGFDEALAAPPASIVLAPGGEVCDVDSVDGARVACHFVVASDAAGPRALQLTAVDLVDNSADVSAALDVEFDFTAPAAVDVATDDRVVLVRAPWGAGADDSAAISVEVAAGVLDAGAALAVFADAAGSRLIAVGAPADPASADASSVDLGVLDRSQVFVAAVDEAGLLSAVVPVVQQRFIATFGSKTRDDFNGNPHVAFAVSAFDDDRDDGGDVNELKDADYAALFPAGAGTVTATTASSWSQRLLSDDPGARSGACLAYDSARGVAVLFGGRAAAADGGADLGDTWILDDGRWQQQGPRTSPSPRSGVGCAYDPLRDVVVLVGGAGTRDVWEWNGDTWRKKGELPGTTALGFGDVAVAYDDFVGAVVVVEDNVEFIVDDDISDAAAFDFDADDAVGVSFDGGFIAVNADGSAVVFKDGVTTPTTGLPAGSTAPVVYVDREVFAIVADNDGGGDARFRLDVSTWTPVAPLPIGDRAGARAVVLSALDDADGQDLAVVVTGGTNGATAFVKGDSAFELQTAALPAQPSQLAFDPGDADDVAGLLANIGGDLYRLTDAGFSEIGNGINGLFVDGDGDGQQGHRASVVIDGGAVLEFDGDGTNEFVSTFITDNDAMTGQVTAGARCVRRDDELVYVSSSGSVFVLSPSHVWSAAPGGPQPGSGFGLASYVVANGAARVVLYPSIDGHTWTFDGDAWTDLGLIGPAAVAGGAVRDVALTRDGGDAFLFGGLDAGLQFTSAAWSFDGADWTQVDDVGPPALSGAVAAFDAHRSRVVVAAGIGAAPNADVWEHNSGAADTPALRFALDLGAAGVDFADTDLVAVDVDAGGDVVFWRDGRWDDFAGDLRSLRRLLTGPDPTVHIALPGARAGVASADHFQATFTLRSH